MKFIIVLGIFIILVFILCFNRLVYYKERIKQSKAVVDVFLKKRYDLLPNLIEVVKGYANYEKNILEEITYLRNNMNKESNNEKLKDYYQEALITIEKYPDLKMSEHFLKLQGSIEKIESELQAARRLYNIDITTYNTKLETFPYNIITFIFRFKKLELPKYMKDDKEMSDYK